MEGIGAECAYIPELGLSYIAAVPMEESTQVCHGSYVRGVEGNGFAIQPLGAFHILVPVCVCVRARASVCVCVCVCVRARDR
jgi:hypothetical protein